jgi:hypothetical protein
MSQGALATTVSERDVIDAALTLMAMSEVVYATNDSVNQATDVNTNQQQEGVAKHEATRALIQLRGTETELLAAARILIVMSQDARISNNASQEEAAKFEAARALIQLRSTYITDSEVLAAAKILIAMSQDARVLDNSN